MPEFRLNSICRATSGKPCGFSAGDVQFSGVSIDSRTIKLGELFVAIDGDKHDGHDFAADAIERGAAGCLVERANGGPHIEVENTLDALHQLASWHRGNLNTTVIGITGSVGKTTARELVRAAFSRARNTFASPKNYNNEFGLPLAVLCIEPETDVAVLELAACKPGDISELARIARPEIGFLTAIAPTHLGSFGSIQTIRETKAELLDEINDTGFAVLNADNPPLVELAKRTNCRTILAGISEAASVRATDIETTFTEHGPITTFRLVGDATVFRLHAMGDHIVSLATCAIAIARECGITLDVIEEGLAEFQPVVGRGNLLHRGTWTFIDETYNAGPTSVCAAMHCLGQWPAQPRVAVLGDMLELGSASAEFHRELGRFVAERHTEGELDFCIAYGEWSDDLTAAAIESGMPEATIQCCPQWNDLVRSLAEIITTKQDGVAMIKGSRGCRLERLFAEPAIFDATSIATSLTKTTARAATRAASAFF